MFSATRSLLAASKTAIRRSLGHPAQRPVKKAAPALSQPLYATNPVSPSPAGFALPTGTLSKLPFTVTRTRTYGLPVYSDFRNGRSRILTIVRKVGGDSSALRQELRRVLSGARVDVRTGGVEVEGNRVQEVKSWLAGLGF